MRLASSWMWLVLSAPLGAQQAADDATRPGGAPARDRDAQPVVALADRPAQHVQVDLSSHFAVAEQGCFVLLDVATNTWTRYAPERCRERFSPCSTFKVPHALVGLETGVLEDGDHVFRWDGTEHSRAVLNRDHTLRTALRHSVVWYYQELAASIGASRMRRHLAALDYGNQDLSGGLTTFWLGSTLKISADEQVALLARLVAETLPLQRRHQALVKELVVLSDTEGVVLHGKTGSHADPALGWFVGWVSSPDGVWVFAANAEGRGVWGATVRRITESILAERGLLPETPALR